MLQKRNRGGVSLDRKKLNYSLLIAGPLSILLAYGFINGEIHWSNPNGRPIGQRLAYSQDPEEASESEQYYQTMTLYRQEPITINGIAQLKTDQTYYYNAERGDIQEVYVTDGQVIKKGQPLFKYNEQKAVYELEDTRREQTRLYNQRERLIDQLSEMTGNAYNWQGDLIEGYWTEDGYQYYVSVPIGKGEYVNKPVNPPVMDESGELVAPPEDGSADGIKDQIRTLNQQIEDIDIKVARMLKDQDSQVVAKTDGKVILNQDGKTDSQVPFIRVISEDISVTGSVSEYEFYALGEDRPVNLYVDAEDRDVTGTMIHYDKIPKVSPRSDESNEPMYNASQGSSGTQYGFTVKADEFIQPGFTVKVQIGLPGYVIPTDAIVYEGEKTFIYTVQDGVAVKKEIKLERQGVKQVVLRGVEEGEVVILYPYDVKEGQTIQVMDNAEFDQFDMEGMDYDGH